MYVSVNLPSGSLITFGGPNVELPSARAGVTGGIEVAAVVLGSGSSASREFVVVKARDVAAILCLLIRVRRWIRGGTALPYLIDGMQLSLKRS